MRRLLFKCSGSVLLLAVMFMMCATVVVEGYYTYFGAQATLSKNRYVHLREFYWQEASDRLIRYKIAGLMLNYTVLTETMVHDVVADVTSRTIDHPGPPDSSY